MDSSGRAARAWYGAPVTKAPGKREQNRLERIRALREAGLRLFLDRGLEQVTIDEIAREAGTAKGNFYRYFDDKEALVAGIVGPMASAMRGHIDGCREALEKAKGRDDLNAAYGGLAVLVAMTAMQNLDACRFYLQESRGPSTGSRGPLVELANEVQDAAIELTRVAVDRGLLEVSDPRISALAVVGSTEVLMLGILSGRLDGVPPTTVAQTMIGMVLDGIRAR